MGEQKAWMTHQGLQLSDNNTEVLLINHHTKSSSKHSLTDVIIGDSFLNLTTIARNLELMFDSVLSMKPQV